MGRSQACGDWALRRAEGCSQNGQVGAGWLCCGPVTREGRAPWLGHWRLATVGHRVCSHCPPEEVALGFAVGDTQKCQASPHPPYAWGSLGAEAEVAVTAKGLSGASEHWAFRGHQARATVFRWGQDGCTGAVQLASPISRKEAPFSRTQQRWGAVWCSASLFLCPSCHIDSGAHRGAWPPPSLLRQWQLDPGCSGIRSLWDSTWGPEAPLHHLQELPVCLCRPRGVRGSPGTRIVKGQGSGVDPRGLIPTHPFPLLRSLSLTHPFPLLGNLSLSHPFPVLRNLSFTHPFPMLGSLSLTHPFPVLGGLSSLTPSPC